jgi:drug/metabolite transporter (DMT)-like permease
LHNRKEHLKYILLAVLVTLLWSSSFIIIKEGLHEIPPLLFAGSRYLLAFIVLTPFMLKKTNRNVIKTLSREQVIRLLALGLVFYTLTQGMLFLGLYYLQSATVSLILNFTPIVVAFASGYMLNEVLSKVQWLGLIFFISGILIYFLPGELAGGETTGIVIMILAVGANAGSALLGRRVNKGGELPAVIVSGISMGFGAVLLFIPSLFYYGMPDVSLKNLILFVWMAVVNTSIAFTLWNKTQRYLPAADSSVINSTMLFQVALLANIFLDEPVNIYQFTGMLVALAGVLLIQLYSVRKTPQLAEE